MIIIGVDSIINPKKAHGDNWFVENLNRHETTQPHKVVSPNPIKS